MGFLAGERVTAARLNRLQPVPYSATGTTTQTVTTTETLIDGCTITLTTETDGAFYAARAVVTHDSTGTSTTNIDTRCFLDGSALSGSARWSGTVASDFGEASMLWQGPVGAAGSHTFDLRTKGGSGVTTQILGVFTKIEVTIYEAV
jgi:hypothetical protein